MLCSSRHCAAVAVLIACLAPLAVGQVIESVQPAGIEVDAQGVLRVRQLHDASGRLSRQRIAQMKAQLDPNVARPSKLRKISLNRLEAAVAEAVVNGTGLTDDMRYLVGMTRLQYVFLYPESGDIVIAGPAEGYGVGMSGHVIGLSSGRTVLELQDLIVALRAFAPQSEPTPIIGCSIDPTQEGLARMQQFLVSIAGRVRPSDDRRIAAGLQESLGGQNITIEGVPASTHFAQVLVEADYRMKLIGIGLEQPPVKITSYVSRANPSSVARNALQRWYFVPDYDAIRVSEDDQAMELVGNGVKLIGASEMVTRHGGRQVAGTVDRASLAFAHSFTKKYAELASHVSVYAQLKNIIDMSVAAAYMQEKDFFAKVDWNLGVFGDEAQLPVETYPVPRQVASAVNVVWKGSTLMTPIGGGVSIEPRQAVQTDNLSVDTTQEVANVQQDVGIAGVDRGTWWWD